MSIVAWWLGGFAIASQVYRYDCECLSKAISYMVPDEVVLGKSVVRSDVAVGSARVAGTPMKQKQRWTGTVLPTIYLDGFRNRQIEFGEIFEHCGGDKEIDSIAL